ncbi:MAG: GHMP family kinase ATP-binding protein [Thermoplasmata archaeon]
MGPTRWAHGWAPGHVTGIFVPAAESRDPRGRGSIGGGIVLDSGARAVARWTPDARARLRVVDDSGLPLPISQEVAERLRGARTGSLEVVLTHDLPIGQGFGMSAAGALATALAVGRLLGIERSRAIEVAHLADLFGGGGLGGVAAILGGGVEFRIRPGIPPWGRIVHCPWPGPVWIGWAGPPIPSPSALADRRLRRRIMEAAQGLPSLLKDPDPRRLLAASERFTDALALSQGALSRRIIRLRKAGAWTMQTMFGRGWLAVPPTAAVDRAVEKVIEAEAWEARRGRCAPRGPRGFLLRSAPVGGVPRTDRGRRSRGRSRG